MDDILNTAGQLGSIGTAVATIALVVLFWKTIQQLEETVKLSKIQSTYRFRPWIGPSGKIEFIGPTGDAHDQFSITIKNYGELPTSAVIAKFIMRNELPNRDLLKSKDLTTFNLGPLLPNMEKRYWFFIDSNQIQKSKAGKSNVFVLLYFEYEHHGGNSGYGVISRYDGPSNSFIHMDMWID